jgi:hypothetical protein
MIAEARWALQRAARAALSSGPREADAFRARVRRDLDAAISEDCPAEDLAAALALIERLGRCECPAPDCKLVGTFAAFALGLPKPSSPGFTLAAVRRLVTTIEREDATAERRGREVLASLSLPIRKDTR